MRTGIDGIQILRAFAVFLVLLAHAETILSLKKYFGIDVSNGFFRAGSSGVDLFFVISGFIIYYVTDGLRSSANGAYAFFVKRFSRIFPFLWFCVLLHLSLKLAWGQHVDLPSYVRAFAVWPDGALEPAQVWTLRHEVLFYICVGFCIYSRKLSFIIFSFLSIPLLHFFGCSFDGPLSVIFSARANISFGLGLIIAWLYLERRVHLPSILCNIVVLTSPLCLIAVVHLLGESEIPVNVSLAVRSLICAFIVYCSLFFSMQGWVVKGLLLIGSASYSIYLTHDIFISFSAIALSRVYPSGVMLAMLVSLSLSIVGGMAIHFFIEKRLVSAVSRALLRRFSDLAP